VPKGGPRAGGGSCDGFSLLEVLVAFAILALSLGVLMQIFSTSLRGTLTSDLYASAADVAESVLALAGTEIPLEPGVHQGEAGAYAWVLEIAEYPPAELVEPPPSLVPYQVAVTVSWRGGDRESTLSLGTLRLVQGRP
jgi:general secretion pathway protein I